MEVLKKISETVVSARWHRALIWVVMLGIMAMLWHLNEEHQESSNDVMVLGSMFVSEPPTMLCDADGTVVYVNSSGLSFLGEEYLPKVQGHSITDWMEPKLAALHVERFKDANMRPLGSLKPLSTEFLVKGELKPATVNIQVVEVNGARVFRVQWVPRIIDEQRKTNEDVSDER